MFVYGQQLVGSSLLLIHDAESASFWMIDFAKTYQLPDELVITHNDEWKVGNHEDGYLIGVDSLIRIFDNITRSYSWPNEPVSEMPNTTAVTK